MAVNVLIFGLGFSLPSIHTINILAIDCVLTHSVAYGTLIYFLIAIGLTPVGSSTVHIYTQTMHRTTQSTQTIHRTPQLTIWEECGPCPVFASYTLAFALQVRKKHGKTSVRVAEEYQLAR